MIIQQYIDEAGFIRIIWQMADGNCLMLKYQTEPTMEMLEEQEAKHFENVAKIILEDGSDIR